MKQNKVNAPLLIFSAILIFSQLCILGINILFSDLPWQSDSFSSYTALDKIIRLSMYFALGGIGIILLPFSLLFKGAKVDVPNKQFALKKMAMCALLLALYIVIQSSAIDIFSFLRITFNFLVTGVVGMLFGPITGASFGIAADIMGFLVHPGTGGFFPAYTIIGALKGFLYGTMLYRGRLTELDSPPSLLRVLSTKALDSVICNLICMTFAHSILYGDSFFTILPLRAYKNLILLPLETVLLYYILNAVWKINKKAKLKF